MKKQSLSTINFVFILTLSLVLAACGSQSIEEIKASGVIEVTNVSLSAEVAGQVVEIVAVEGETVEAGQLLMRLNSDLLDAQLLQAEAELAMTEASYLQIKAASEIERLAAEQAIEDLLANAGVVRAEKLLEIATLQDAVKDAERRVNSIRQGGKQTDIDTAQANVVLLADQLDDVQENFEDFAGKPETNLTRAALQLRFSEAQSLYDDAVRLLNNLEADPNDIDLAIAEANLLLLESSLIVSQDKLEQMGDGPDPDALAIAQARLDTAVSTVALAQSQVDAAEAAVNLLRIQVEKTSIQAPFEGVILNNLAEIGETVFPGAPLVNIADPTQITITVYIPEDRYGLIGIGDKAALSVDSFSDESFEAVITTIADQAEYTPRNVQTEEDRRTTVFAIELLIEDGDGKLKSGMPGDVVFTIEE